MSLAQLRRLRWAVRGVLTLGVAASVAANILHAEPNTVSQVIAGWPPIALLITIEMVSRVPVHRTWLANVRRLGTTVIAGIAAWVSYWHMAGVAARYGEHAASPYLLPLSVDGLVVIASVSLVELAGRVRDLTEQPTPQPAPEQPEPVIEPATDVSTPNEPDKPRQLPIAAVKIARLRQRNPEITQEEAAKKVGVSVRTAVRHWPDTEPDAQSEPEPANGRVPDLEGVPS
jgi:hypothetical protein